jgi:hypothetical protein
MELADPMGCTADVAYVAERETRRMVRRFSDRILPTPTLGDLIRADTTTALHTTSVRRSTEPRSAV